MSVRLGGSIGIMTLLFWTIHPEIPHPVCKYWSLCYLLQSYLAVELYATLIVSKNKWFLAHSDVLTACALVSIRRLRSYSSPPLATVRSIASVCLSTSISQNRLTSFNKCLMHVAYGRGSVLFWRRCDMSRTSGFVDDVTFARNRPGKGNVAYTRVTHQVQHWGDVCCLRLPSCLNTD